MTTQSDHETNQFVVADEVPSPLEFCNLRVLGGLSAMNPSEAANALPRSLYSVTVRDEGNLIAMARLVGDGLHNLVTDVVVLPNTRVRDCPES